MPNVFLNFGLFGLFLQKALRLADAKAVEAKAARIKDWVTNKLRELEEQNAHLKVQNAKANDQMELLRNRLEQLQVLGSTTKSRQTSMAEVRNRVIFNTDKWMEWVIQSFITGYIFKKGWNWPYKNQHEITIAKGS